MPTTACHKTIGLMTVPALLFAALLAGARADERDSSTPGNPRIPSATIPESGLRALFSEVQQLAGEDDSPTARIAVPTGEEPAEDAEPAEVVSADETSATNIEGHEQVGWAIGHYHADHGSEGCAACQGGEGHHHHGEPADNCEYCGSAVVVHEGRGYRMTGNRWIDGWKKLSMKMHAGTMKHYYQAKAKWWNPDRWNPRDCDDNGCSAGCNGNGDGSGRLWMEKRLERTKCRFGYFLPTGCCGGGCPTVGSYHMVYSANPDYFDPRDGQIYGAQGYGVPMAVPLAPNVEKTYNFGWGVPSSRLTPISRRLPE